MKNWPIRDFDLTWLTKNPVTHSIFEVEGSSFGFRLIFVCSKIHILQLKLSEWFFNDLIFLYPLPRGGRLKNLNWNFVQNFCFEYLGKVKKIWCNICMRLKAINNNAKNRVKTISSKYSQNRTIPTELIYYHLRRIKVYISVIMFCFSSMNNILSIVVKGMLSLMDHPQYLNAQGKYL